LKRRGIIYSDNRNGVTHLVAYYQTGTPAFGVFRRRYQRTPAARRPGSRSQRVLPAVRGRLFADDFDRGHVGRFDFRHRAALRAYKTKDYVFVLCLNVAFYCEERFFSPVRRGRVRFLFQTTCAPRRHSIGSGSVRDVRKFGTNHV